MSTEDTIPQPAHSSSSSIRSLDLPDLEPVTRGHHLLSLPTYDPDVLLQSRSHVPSDELRGELRSHLNELREELVQLINEDYEEFISLGVGLRGEVHRLKRLEGPLLHLQDEIDSINESLRSQEIRLETSLTLRAEIRDETILLESMQKLFDAVTRIEVLDESVSRIGNEYSQIQYLLRKLETKGCSVISVLEPRLARTKQRIEEKLATVLVEAISQQSSSQILDTLRVYDVIEGWKEAQNVVAVMLTKICDQTISPESLLSGLAPMYDRVLDQVRDLHLLFDLAEEISPRFALVESVLIPCIVAAIRKNIGREIFSAGRPDELHKNYTLTTKFIDQIESFAPSSSAVLSIRASSEISLLQRQWQLPVYFQLRWKDITAKLERWLEQPPPDPQWLIPQTAGVFEAVELCWSDNVFIPDLADRFWRLTLQILSRYRGWLAQYHSGPDEDARLQTGIRASIDLERLRVKLQSLLRDHDVQSYLSALLSSTEYTQGICSILSTRCVEQLKPIRAVASQLRTTTKSPGSSPYIQSVFRPLLSVIKEYPTLDSTNLAQSIAQEVFSQFSGMVSSVRKTEDLLRRHRKSRKTGFSLFGSSDATEGTNDAIEEERRFDAQMRIDIDKLGAEASALRVDIADMRGWRELSQVMDGSVSRDA